MKPETTANLARAIVAVLVAGAIVLLVLMATGGNSYNIRMEMPNASGLRPGSQVLLGGVGVGTVDELDFDKRARHVVATLKLDKKKVVVGKGASASVVAANLLGEKYVALRPGDSSQPVEEDSALPASRLTLPTDLDQIVGVLDKSTRARLAMLLHDAGVAVSNRKEDVNAILRQFPLSLDAATSLLETMVQDNRTLAELVESSNSFIVRMNRARPDLERVIRSSAGAASVVAERADDLARALPDAPAGFRGFDGLFTAGADAVAKLDPSVPLIADALPELDRLLRAARPFTAEAVPTLEQAGDVAPDLNRLAIEATPTLRQAVPMLRSLRRVAGFAQPLSAWLGLSSEDLVNIFNGWTRAIQFRDGLSHVFNGTLYLNPRVVLGTANRGATARQRCQNLLDVRNNGLLRAMGELGNALSARSTGCGGGNDARPAKPDRPARPQQPAQPAPQQQQQAPKPVLEQVLEKVKVPNLPRVPDLPGPVQPVGSTVNDLLDFLLKP